MDKCLIVRYQLGSRVWFLVEQNNRPLSTPLDSFGQATEWIRTMTDVQRLGCYRLSRDLTEVLISDNDLDLDIFSLKTGEIFKMPTLVDEIYLNNKKHRFIGGSK